MKLFGDLKNTFWIHVKGWLFLAVAGLASFGLRIQIFSWTNCLLIFIALWAACRWYYYMFYVIEKYVDPSFRFAGLSSVIRFLITRKQG